MDPVVQTGQKRGLGVGAFLLALVTAGALAHVGVRMKGIEVAYDLGREKRVNTQLEEERRRLNIEIGMLKDPVRVVALARETLKMGPPAPTAIVRLVPGQMLGGPAAPAPAADVPKRKAAAKAPEPAKASWAAHAPRRDDAPKVETPAVDDEPPAGEAPAREGGE